MFKINKFFLMRLMTSLFGLVSIVSGLVVSLHLLAVSNNMQESYTSIVILFLGLLTFIWGVIFIFYFLNFIYYYKFRSGFHYYFLMAYTIYVAFSYGYLSYENFYNGILVDGFFKTIYLDYMEIVYVFSPFVFSLIIFYKKIKG